MDIQTLGTYAITAIGSGGLVSLLFVGAKKRNMNARSRKIEVEAESKEGKSSLDLLDDSFTSLVKIYDAKFKVQAEVFELRFTAITMKYDALKFQMDEMVKQFDIKEQGYKLDLEQLALYRACAEEMKKCPNFATCPGAMLYHKLINK